MSFSPKIVVDDVKIKVDFTELNDRIQKAQEWLDRQVFEDTKTYMPFLTGNLLQESAARNNYGSGMVCVGAGVYARYLYEGNVMIESDGRHAFYIEGVGWRHHKGSKLIPTTTPLVYTNPEAEDHWFNKSKEMNLNKWVEGVKGIINGQ